MKREQIIKKIEVEAANIYGESVKVYTCRAISPKCFLCAVYEDGSAKQITPAFLPTALLAYVQGVHDGLEMAMNRMLNK